MTDFDSVIHSSASVLYSRSLGMRSGILFDTTVGENELYVENSVQFSNLFDEKSRKINIFDYRVSCESTRHFMGLPKSPLDAIC